MTVSDRDRKILIFVVPVMLVVAYWFLLLSPKRDAAAEAGEKLDQAKQAQTQAEQELAQARSTRTTFTSDYSVLVKLGKAIPAEVDMPTLVVQLDHAARGTGISFERVATTEQAPGAAAATPTPPAAPGGDRANPAAPGGTPAESTPGQQTEDAGAAVGAANTQNSANAAASGVDPADAQTSTSTDSGLPVGGGTSPTGAAAGQTGCAPGLVCVPLEFKFTGRFFELADFFHKMKRFVRVANGHVAIGGRLITVDSLNFTSDDQNFPGVVAEVTATVYLSPPAEGVTAGATQQGPADVVPAAAETPASPSTTPPTATATP